MSGCLGCSCERPGAPAQGSRRLLLSTQVAHTLTALRAALREVGVDGVEQAPGLIEATCSDVSALVLAVRSRLSSVEAAEVHAVQLGAEQGHALVAAALGASTLAQLSARAEHADLLPLFADEHAAFRSVYQPIVALGEPAVAELDGVGTTHGHRVIGYEALLRATGPAGPLLPPALFGAAEQAGWLHVLDRVGRTTALRGAAGWLGDDLLFVNFLPTSIYRPQVCLRTTEQAARDAGLRLEQLVFEVTESERVTDLDHLDDVFAYYRDRGCKVALDDLGAGYSSLNMLVRLQPDVVKLDKDLVQRLPGKVSAAVVAAVVEIAHAYGGQVLAECVETADQAAAARDLGVDLGQGWLFGRPQDRTPAVVAPATRRPRRIAEPAAWPAAPAFDGNDPAVALPAAARSAASTAPASDVTASAEFEQQVDHLSHHDQLTGLPNRLHLLRSLQQETDRALADGSRLAVLFLDLDGFKAVNDRYGHTLGDLTLAAAAACLRGALRDGDLLARYSGDEFVAVLTDVPAGTAERVAQRTADAVVGSLTTPLLVAGEHVQLGASVGVAIFPEDGNTPEQLLQAADRAMYAAKRTGRGRALLAAAVY